ncbi:3-hydroxyacyl-ACP dehydratase FabZ family protein [Flagellimonas flava]|nr:hydroxymyristoyl-ACP dehydratase [Allomuricauda flava]
MTKKEVLSHLPYQEPFLFVDGLTNLDQNSVCGHYTFKADALFYQGHFKNSPVTPGVLLTECCAQIGLVCLGIYLLDQQMDLVAVTNLKIAMSRSQMDFYLPVLPGEKVTVKSEKEYFRFNKLKCKVKLFNAEDRLVCKGILEGMFKSNADEK